MLIIDELKGRRIYRCTETGRTAISVTTCAADVASPGEDEFAGVNPSLLRMHCDEGTGCHHAALDWLAFTHQMLPAFTVPEKPPFHPDERRWKAVLANAVKGMQEWSESRAVTPLEIERSSANFTVGIAGTPDLYAELCWRGRRVQAIVELKFTASITLTHRAQVIGYHMLDGYSDARIGLIVHIDRTTGNWKEVPVYWEADPWIRAKILCCVGRWK